MAYEVIARKWRPQQFEDVVGQEHVVRTLTNAISSNRIAHAYLFVGPRGIGKTTLARIFAKALNCEKGPIGTPCDTCDSCREIAAGTDMDVHEIDGASNNGVDQVRELRDTVVYTPVRGNFKIFIIDEVHMLSPAAFNALLKTLEEPPPHVKFIFATTEPQRILPTILSRCQRFDLRRISTPAIAERLNLIATEEKVEVDDDAILAIARGAEGGLRDAESALDQLISFKGKSIQEDDVLSVFGMVSRQGLENLAEAILKSDIPGVIAMIAELDQAGKDVQRLVVELLDYFRHLLVCVSLEGKMPPGDLTESQAEQLTRHAELTNVDRILKITDILIEADGQLRYALSKRTLLETALIRCCRSASVASLQEILNRINNLRDSGDAPVAVPDGTPVETAQKAPPEDAASDSAPVSTTTPPKKKVEPEAELKLLQEQWQSITSRAGRVTVMARSCFLDARPVSVEEGRVVIGFDAEFEENLVNARTPRIAQTVQRIIGKVLGRTVGVDYLLLEGEPNAGDPAPADTALQEDSPPDGSSAAEPDDEPGHDEAGQDDETLLGDPAVKNALEAFKGRVVGIRR